MFEVLRKQPGNFEVYAPRELANEKSRRSRNFNLERLLPSSDWVRSAWQPSEEELLSSSGLDAVVFMRIFIFSFRVFTVAGIIGLFVILPVNFSGDQLEDFDFSNFTNNSLDLCSISNVKNGSQRCMDYTSGFFTNAMEHHLVKLERLQDVAICFLGIAARVGGVINSFGLSFEENSAATLFFWFLFLSSNH
ncbi:unnamed protein product [Ilex paraguariensis]|uniref:CSC1/OSCA1-like N-terminal transmembrane domain-containing protein n=1 Tax=Ilex paraguariensis TaxID=185542 RepID=A0ABC8UYX8_9AQUA